MFFTKAPDIDYQGAWMDYSRWIDEERQTYERNVSAERTRLAAMGRKPGDEIYDQRIAALEQDYQSALESLKSGPTYELLEQNYVTQQRNQEKMAAEKAGWTEFRGRDYESPTQFLERRASYQRNILDREEPFRLLSRQKQKAETALEEISSIRNRPMEDYYTSTYGTAQAEAPKPRQAAGQGRAGATGSSREIGSIWI